MDIELDFCCCCCLEENLASFNFTTLSQNVVKQMTRRNDKKKTGNYNYDT